MSERITLLEHRHRELEQLVYAISHELKFLLRAMMHLANWIGEDTVAILPEPSKAHLVKLRKRIKHMEQLLDDLLAYTSAERQPYRLERVDTAALVQEVVGLLAIPSTFTVTIERDLPVIAAERMALEAVFRNLIKDILKHRPQPPVGHLSISAYTPSSQLEFSVVDDGSGDDPALHKRLFQLFQPIKAYEQQKNMDLGLVIVKKLIESRGGAIEVEAKAGSCAIFRFTWPK